MNDVPSNVELRELVARPSRSLGSEKNSVMAKKLELVVLGDGGHSAAVAEAATSSGFSVSGHFDIRLGETGLHALIERVAQLELDRTALALGIGTNHVRAHVHRGVISVFPEAMFPPIVHQTAWVSPSSAVHDGAVVLAFAAVGPRATAGVGSLINTGGSLDHDSTVGDYGSLGPGARTGGNTSIGAQTMVGMQAGILQGRTVGNDTVIGAHSLVVRDIPGLCVAYGTPCRVIRERDQEDHYF